MVIEATFDIRTILSEVRKVIHQNLPVESYIKTHGSESRGQVK